VELPEGSRATAVSVWLPFAVVVVSHATLYGAAVSSAPRLAPSSLNWTPATETLSPAVAFTETVFATVAPPAGAVTETVGAVVSAVAVAVASGDGPPTFPAASSAVTR
jgi:hypothetical protein